MGYGRRIQYCHWFRHITRGVHLLVLAVRVEFQMEHIRMLRRKQKEAYVRFQVLTAASMMFPDDGGSTHL
jgi:hypothetical protein